MKTIFRDILVLAGFGLIVYASWLAWRPLAFAVTGLGLLAFAVAWQTVYQRVKEEHEHNRRAGL